MGKTVTSKGLEAPGGSAGHKRDLQESQDAHFAMNLSLIVGVLMLLAKVAAYIMTHFSSNLL